MVSLAYRYTRDRELALDVLQETFLYVLGKFPGFELRSEMKTFLYPTVRHLSVALQSKATRRPPDPCVDERSRGLAELMEALPIGQREVLILRFADGLSQGLRVYVGAEGNVVGGRACQRLERRIARPDNFDASQGQPLWRVGLKMRL